MFTPRHSGLHGSPMLSLTYREMKFRASSEMYARINEFAGASGLSFSEIIRQALEQFLSKGPSIILPDQSIVDDDPSNPLG